MRECSSSTQAEIARLSELPTKPAWLKLAVYDATHGKPMSRQREERMINALSLPPLPRLVETPACPVHGIAHCYDCRGLDDPVVTVRQRKPRHYSRIADMPALMLAQAIRERREWPAMEC